MKYGVHAAMWMRSWQDDVAPYLERAARLGFDGAELSLLGMDDANVARLRDRAQALGLELTCTTGLAADSDITSDDPEIRAVGERYLAWAIRTAAGLGSSLLTGVIYAPWGQHTADRRNERLQRSAEALKRAAPLAQELGVVLGIEAINRYETDLITTAAEATELAELVDEANVGVLLDSYHMNIEEADIGAAVRATGDRLVHVHCVDNDRGAPGGGHLPWEGMFEALSDLGYDGWLTLELFILANEEVSPDLSVWRPIEDDPDEAARSGLAFLRERVAAAGGSA
jgi:D-psicose/D-tagatose/L-ribulose 3-epimerase